MLSDFSMRKVAMFGVLSELPLERSVLQKLLSSPARDEK
jgi:hypothetical protein